MQQDYISALVGEIPPGKYNSNREISLFLQKYTTKYDFVIQYETLIIYEKCNPFSGFYGTNFLWNPKNPIK